MQSNDVESSRFKKAKTRKRDPLNVRRKGRIYSRGEKLWIDFRYLGQRVREPSGLDDTQCNRITLRSQLDLIMAEIDNSSSSSQNDFRRASGRSTSADWRRGA
jgi:hypothetical protein